MLRNKATATAAAVAAVALLHGGYADATFINSSTTGLASPAVTQDFTSPSLACSTSVTNQFAYVSFSPAVYLCPQSGSDFDMSGNPVANFYFVPGVRYPPNHPPSVDPVFLTFSSTQTGGAFRMAGDTTRFAFEALLNGVVVDSGSGIAPDPVSTYFGFTGDTFNQILISQPDGGAPYWLIGDLELSSASSVPEPAALGLFGAGFAILVGALWLRRSWTGWPRDA